MIRTYLNIQVKEGQAEQLAAVFRERRILETAVEQPGCHTAELLFSVDETCAVVTATWDDMSAYDRWTHRDDREGLSSELSAHLSKPINAETVGVRFHVAHLAVSTGRGAPGAIGAQE